MPDIRKFLLGQDWFFPKFYGYLYFYGQLTGDGI